MLIIVKPAKENVKVRKENGAHLSVDGEQVQSSAFWKRRIKDGDAIELSKADAEAWVKARDAAKQALRDEAKKVKAAQVKAAKAKATETEGE